MNGKIRTEALEEQRKLRMKRLYKCFCGASKMPKFHICRACALKKQTKVI